MTTDNGEKPKVLVLTPMKNVAVHLPRYIALLEALDWPKSRLSLGILEGDSTDGSADLLRALEKRLGDRVSRLVLLQHDFGFQFPAGVPRWSPAYQLTRRAILARARNRLLFGALQDEDYVLWLDADLASYPADSLSQLIDSGFDIVMPHCLAEDGSTFDLNAWADGGRSGFQDASSNSPIRLDAVGGTMLLVRADIHREGLVFPTFPYGNENKRARSKHPVWGRGEIETEGLGLLAADMGVQCWGLPQLRIVHSNL